MRYEVWMGFKNYKGEVYDVTQVAIFFSKTRAEEYVRFCKTTGNGSAAEDVLYYIGEY